MCFASRELIWCAYTQMHDVHHPLYGFTYPVAPHTLCLLDINDVILTEPAHLFSSLMMHMLYHIGFAAQFYLSKLSLRLSSVCSASLCISV